MRLLTGLLFLLLAPVATAAQPLDPVESARAATVLLRQTAEALGGEERLRAARSIEWEMSGQLFWLNQGPTPETPMRLQLRQRQNVDFGNGLTALRLDIQGPESSFQRNIVLRNDESGALLQFAALSPAVVVRHLLARPRDLRLIADGIAAGPVLGHLVHLEIGTDGLPSSLSHAIIDDVHGDSLRRFDYQAYRPENGWMAPERVRQSDAGRVALDAALLSFSVDSGRPQWSEGLEPRQAPAAGRESNLVAEPVAPGVHHLRGYGGSDYHGLAVELTDGWMVLETPPALGDGTELRRVLANLSDKPVLYAAATHHHDDHSAGMPVVAERGATVLATRGNVEYFTRMLAASRSFRPGIDPRVVALEDGQRLGPVQFIMVSTEHAREMLVFYLPEHRVLFHSDMGRFNDDGSVEPARPQTCALLSLIETRGLAVERIYSGHGRPGTMDDLRRSVAARAEGCSA